MTGNPPNKTPSPEGSRAVGTRQRGFFVSRSHRGLLLGAVLGAAVAGTAIPVSEAESVIDTTADAVQTFYQQSGVPHVDRQGRFRSTYDSASSFLPRGLYHMLPCEVSKTITFEPFTGTPDPNLGVWNGDYNVAVTLGSTLDASPLALLQSVAVAGPGTGTLEATVHHLPADTVLTYAVGLAGTFQVVEQGPFLSSACPDPAVATPVRLLSDAGFNVSMPFPHNGSKPPAVMLEEGSPALASVLLEQGDATNVATVIGPPLVPTRPVNCDPDCEWVIDSGGILVPWAEPWFNAYKDDPRVFGFYFTDEPLVHAVLDSLSIQSVYDTVLETYNTYKDQTDHPFFFAEFYPPLSQEADARWNDFVVNLADAATHDNYFKNVDETLETMAPLAESVRRQTAAAAGNKPSWVVPQAFDYINSDAQPGGWQGWDFLTPQEMRAYIYTAIVHGATGFFHFAWDSHIMRGGMIGIHPATPATQYLGTGRVASTAERQQSIDLWRSLDAREAYRGVTYGLNAQLESLTPIILSRTSDEPYGVWVNQAPLSAAPIRTMLKEYESSFYLFAVNIDKLTVQATISFPFRISSASVLFEDREASISDFTLEETFTPFAAHVYQIVRQPAILGDANCSGVVDARDALTVLQYDVGMGTIDQLTFCSEATFLSVADVNGDTLINSLDALIILQYAAGILDSLETRVMTAGHEDTDGDFMTDQQEALYNSCLNASVNDWAQNPDADGFTNAAELVLGANPCLADAYPPPAAPTGFTASVISSTTIRLTWNAQPDNDYWRIERSLNSTSGYAVLFPHYNANYEKVYDTTVESGKTYYYRLFAVNATGDSLYAQASATATNTPPQLTVPADQTVTVSGKLFLSVSASDPDSDALTLGAANLPAGASFTDNGNGTGLLSWTPTSSQAGLAYPVTFTASDGVNPPVSGNTTFTVAVPPPPPPPPTPPTVTISSPAANATVPATGFSFTGSASDAGGVAAVQVTITNGKLTVVDRAPASYNPSTQVWSFPVQESHLTPGTTPLLSVRAKDTQGNWSSLSRSVTVVSTAPTLSVSLTVTPSTGTAPLTNVDLTGDVAGTATGTIRYRFDCTDDGTWESDTTTSSDPYTKVDLCTYASAGTYIARVRVDRGGLGAEDKVTLTVSTAPTLSITGVTPSVSSGAAPLNGVSFSVAATGTLTDDNPHLYIDCDDSNGQIEPEDWHISVNDISTIYNPTPGVPPYVTPPVCNYANPGTYTVLARLVDDRTGSGLSSNGTTVITVNNPTPPAVTGLNVVTMGKTWLKFQWSSTPYATNYDVWRRKWSDGSQMKYWNVPSSTTEVSDCGELEGGTAYEYAIRPNNGAIHGPMTTTTGWTNYVNVSCP